MSMPHPPDYPAAQYPPAPYAAQGDGMRPVEWHLPEDIGRTRDEVVGIRDLERDGAPAQPVPRALEQLSDQLGRISQVVDRLLKRLESATRSSSPDPTAPGGMDAARVAAPQSALRVRVDSLTARAKLDAVRLESLLDRLEL